MTIKEVYEKYKHVDDILSNLKDTAEATHQFTRQIFIENYRGQLVLLCDLWLAIKNNQENPAVPQGVDCVEREAVLGIMDDETRPTMPHWARSPIATIQKIRTRITYLLPAVPASQALPASGQARPDGEIEKAIKYFEQSERVFSHSLTGGEVADFVRWVLNQEQDTWSDEELLGKEAQDEKDTGV